MKRCLRNASINKSKDSKLDYEAYECIHLFKEHKLVMYAEAWGRFWSWGHKDEINIVFRPHSKGKRSVSKQQGNGKKGSRRRDVSGILKAQTGVPVTEANRGT